MASYHPHPRIQFGAGSNLPPSRSYHPHPNLPPSRGKGLIQRFPWCIVDTLNQLDTINRFLDLREVAKMAKPIMEQADREAWKHALEAERADREGEEEEDEISLLQLPERPTTDLDEEKAEAKRLEKDRSLLARKAGRSIFANTTVMDRAIGRLMKKVQGEIERKHPMPAVIVSGIKTFLTYGPYAGVSNPRPGYLRIKWDDLVAEAEERFRLLPEGMNSTPAPRYDLISGVGMAPSDTRKYNKRLDTPDCDGDTVTVIFTVDGRGQHGALVMRSPSSFDAGAHLKVNKQDVQQLTALGFHFYQLTGGYHHPDLYDLDSEGNEIHTDALSAAPYDPELQWHPAGMNLVDTLLRMCLDQKALGQMCNAMWGLVWPGKFDVSRLKFNFSESGVDANFNATGDPWPVVEALWNEMLDLVQQGVPMEKCLWPRVERELVELHQRRQKDIEEQGGVSQEFPKVKLVCYGPHDALRNATNQAQSHTTETTRRRKLLSNGPAQRLVQVPAKKLMDIAIPAYHNRNAKWGEAMDEKRDIEERRDLKFNEKASMTDRLMAGTQATEKRIIQAAYHRAAKLPDYQLGDFLSLWMQLTLTRQRRFEGAEGGPQVPQPVPTHTLFSAVDEDEVTGYYGGDAAEPTVLLRTSGPRCELPQGAIATIKKSKNGLYSLCDSEGNEACRLKSDARLYHGLSLEVLGYMPDLTRRDEQTEKRTRWNQGPMGHRQEPGILALRVLPEGLESY